MQMPFMEEFTQYSSKNDVLSIEYETDIMYVDILFTSVSVWFKSTNLVVSFSF